MDRFPVSGKMAEVEKKKPWTFLLEIEFHKKLNKTALFSNTWVESTI